MTTKEKLLALLEDSKGTFFSGEEIARTLQVSRAAVWKAVNALREDGYTIDAATNKGYRLSPDSDILSPQGIRRFLKPEYRDLDLTVLPTAPSTNALVREKANQEVLWRGLRRGEIQTISTDHCSFTLAQKDAGREDFTKIPGGLPGVETRGELIYSYGVAAKKLSLAQMCRVLSENPAKLYGLYPRKGVLAPGSDADIVIYDPGDSHVIRAEDCVANVDYNPYEGFVTAGGIREVWLRGRKTVENGKVLDTVPAGMYLARGKCDL